MFKRRPSWGDGRFNDLLSLCHCCWLRQFIRTSKQFRLKLTTNPTFPSPRFWIGFTLILIWLHQSRVCVLNVSLKCLNINIHIILTSSILSPNVLIWTFRNPTFLWPWWRMELLTLAVITHCAALLCNVRPRSTCATCWATERRKPKASFWFGPIKEVCYSTEPGHTSQWSYWSVGRTFQFS